MTTIPCAAGTVQAALARLAGVLRGASGELQALLAQHPGTEHERLLAEWLYANWYSSPPAGEQPAPLPRGRASLVPVLRAALAGTGRWERTWVVLSVLPDNACWVGRGERTRLAVAGDYANVARPGVPVAPGDGVAVLDRLEWLDPATGFWAARSEAEPAPPHRRVYWSVGWQAVAAVLREVVPALDAAGRPWSLKCPGEPAQFARTDSLVVYVARADWPVFEPLLRTVAARLAARLREAVPPLALPVARGVAIADSPASGQSFGEHRCAALAEGARALLLDPDTHPADAAALLETSLRRHGIDPARPWACD